MIMMGPHLVLDSILHDPTRLSGDLDGDLYWTCWDESLVSAIQPLQQPDVPTTTEPARGGAGAVGRSCWLEDAQRHMMDPDTWRHT